MEGTSQTVTVTENEGSAAAARAACVERHFDRLSLLLDGAEALAEVLLGGMMRRARQQEPVYISELIQLCRGLHVLAKCGLELRRQLKLIGQETGDQPGITEAQIDQLEERLRPLFAQKAA